MEILPMRWLLVIAFSAHLYGHDDPVTYWKSGPMPGKWGAYLDPNHLEFWKEGDYTPPAPLIWAMKDPTPQNISLYKTYLQKRAAILELFQQAMKKEQIDKVAKIYVAFRSDCKACHQFLTELSAHPEVFERIQLLQVDTQPVPLAWANTQLSPQAKFSLNIDSVPTVWVQFKNESPHRLTHPGQLFEEVL